MNDSWDIQALRMAWRTDPDREREAVLRPLARLLARRLLAEELAKPENEGKTMDSKRTEVAA